MENTTDVIELLDILSGMVTEAWGVPIGNDKCIIERQKATEIIEQIKSNLPSAISEAKRLVAARDEFIGNAKREAEALRKTAEEKARSLVEQQEIVRVARQQSAEMISSAEAKSNELRRMASEYADGVMQTAEDALNAALADVTGKHSQFRALGSGKSVVTPQKKVPAKAASRQEQLPDDEFDSEASFPEFHG